MAVLDDIKILLDIEDPASDASIKLYIRKAVALITNYLNAKTAVDIATVYPDAVIEYVLININRKGMEGITKLGQESRSVEYGDDLPDSVKNLLPKPYVTMLGVRRGGIFT